MASHCWHALDPGSTLPPTAVPAALSTLEPQRCLPVAIPVARPVGGALVAPLASLPVARLATSCSVVAAPSAGAAELFERSPSRRKPQTRATARRDWRGSLQRRALAFAAMLPTERCRAMLAELGHGREWLLSAAVHMVVIIVLGCLTVQSSSLRPLELFSSMEEVRPPQELESVVVMPDFNEVPSPDAAISLATTGQASTAPPLQGLLSLEPPDFSGTVIAENESPLELLDSPLDSFLGEALEGVQERTVDAGDTGGAVDRLTMEILAQLEDNKLLVVWLMDASQSLRSRREEIISRFTRVYEELDALVDKKDSPLLTGVVAFGQNTVFMTEAPTADRAAITQAVQDIPADESGVENVFHAVGETINQWRSNHGRNRLMMLIALTDEAGDDAQSAEAAVSLAKQSRVRVYAIGPAAPFAQEQVLVKWTDSQTGDVFRLPVHRGPEAAQIEHPRLIGWQPDGAAPALRSGYGPYALAWLVHATGGVYFLDDDSTLTGPRMDPAALSAYSPDYASPAEYAQQIGRSPLRRAVLESTTALEGLPELPTGFLSAGIQFAIRGARRDLDRTLAGVDDSLARLQAVAGERKVDSSRRWQAHYDLLYGRLLATKARCLAYATLADSMFTQPQVPTDSTKNAWQLTCVAEADEAAEAGDAESPLASAAREARRQLETVVEEHPGTPWSAWAQAELKLGIGLEWRESFIDPPPGIPLPWDKKPWDELTEQEKKAKQQYEERKAKAEQQEKAREEAKKRIPKL